MSVCAKKKASQSMNAEILTNTFSYPDLRCVIEWLTHNGKEKKSIN